MTNGPMRLMRASDLIGLPVVTIDGGDDIAEIKDVVFDGTRHQLVGFTLNKRGWFRGSLHHTLDMEHVSAIGADAVMVRHEEDLAARESAPAPLSDPGESHDVMGNTVVTSGGKTLGTVSGVVISVGEKPAAVGYQLTSDDGDVFIPIDAQMALSSDNLIVPSEAADFVNRDLAGFGASVTQYRSRLDDAITGDAS